jgi:hypothetical protein
MPQIYSIFIDVCEAAKELFETGLITQGEARRMIINCAEELDLDHLVSSFVELQ